MLKTKFEGKIELLGSGRYQSSWFIRRSLIKIGDQRLKNVVASDELDDTLEAGVENADPVKISVGWVMFYRWLLAVNHNGETLRQGIFLLLAGMITHFAVSGLAGLIGGLLVAQIVSEALGTILGIGIVAYGLVTGVLNIKAWLAPDF